MAIAWMAKDWPRSTCTHCVPFRNSTASSSTASFLPSVIRLNSPKYGGTLLVTVLPRATFVTPLGTSMDGGATSETGSIFGPAGKFSGVPLSVWRGRSSLSGSVALVSAARAGDAKQPSANARSNRDLDKSFFIKITTRLRKHPSRGRTRRVKQFWQWSDVRDAGSGRFPLTLTLSRREREQRALRSGKPRDLDCSPSGEGFTLSPRERAGVRGKRPMHGTARVSSTS